MIPTVLVTGGIGSGKSAVCAYLAGRGVPVYDSDSRTKALYDTDPSLTAALEETLGCPLRTAEGKLDRKALAAIIFSDEDARTRVEERVYPYVREDFLRWREEKQRLPWCGYTNRPFVVMESAIALQKPLFADLFDKVVLVDAPIRIRLKRVVRRDGMSWKEAACRVHSQTVIRARADAVLRNAGPYDEIPALTDGVFYSLF